MLAGVAARRGQRLSFDVTDEAGDVEGAPAFRIDIVVAEDLVVFLDQDAGRGRDMLGRNEVKTKCAASLTDVAVVFDVREADDTDSHCVA